MGGVRLLRPKLPLLAVPCIWSPTPLLLPEIRLHTPEHNPPKELLAPPIVVLSMSTMKMP